ncbi:hypothetical protein SADUNF_Sadunf16G0027500 [Salix dunnii]|uniref:HIRAN domain-containing protein n=1 Tax=Salix dunnii TaxID=1413687 RepID=A0A835MFH3_9ROSI|nr:hypothetical protein SADUNF_Sadunf16G0027500 [Salix dunnii]
MGTELAESLASDPMTADIGGIPEKSLQENEIKEYLGSLSNLGAWKYSSSSSPQTLLNGTSVFGLVMANIVVSLRYRLLFFTDRESVRLELEPRKPDDQNAAIKVLNADYLEVGYIDRSVATVLYPLIENKMINVEGVMPRASSDGFPFEISMFARLDDFETVKTAISQGGLVLFSQPGAGLALFQAMVANKQSRVGRKAFNSMRIGVNSEPVILYTQEPILIQRGFSPTPHTFKNKPKRITDRPAVQAEREQLNFIPIGAVGQEGFQEDLVSLYNLDDWDDSSSFYDWDYTPPQQVLLNETSIVGFAMASIIVSSGCCTVFFNERESVRLVLHRRKPGDQNQNPAIKVLNADNLEVGYLDRSVTTVLSPLIDNKMINAEGVILGSRTRSNKLVACQVCISAKLHDFGTVKTAISQGGLDLVSRPGSSFAPSQEAMVVKEKNSEDGDRSVNEKFSSVEGNLKKRGRKRFSNYEPLIFHTQGPVIIENQNGVGLAETTLEIEPENINLKHALKVEPAQLNFIPIVRVHAASAAQPVNGSDLNECLDLDSLLAKSDEVEGDKYPTNYWFETFPKMLLQGDPENSFKKMRLR